MRRLPWGECYDDLLWLAHLDVTDREREIPAGLEAATECG
jgi:hypothetical protein